MVRYGVAGYQKDTDQEAIMTVPNLPAPESMNVSEARKQFSDLLNRVHRDEKLIVVEKSGIPVAGIVPMAVVQAAQEKAANRQKLLDVLQRTQSAFDGVPEEEIEREVELALKEIKQERRMARRIVAAISRVAPDAFTVSDESLESTIAQVLEDESRRDPAGKAVTVANAT